FLRTARVELFQIADEQHLERGHERRRLRAVECFEDIRLGKINVREAEIAEVCRDKDVKHCTAAALVAKNLIADEDITRAQLSAAEFGEEAVGRSEACSHSERLPWGSSSMAVGIFRAIHQNDSRISETSACAKSRARRWTAAGSS